MMSRAKILIAVGAALGLAGCNEGAGMPGPNATSPVAVSSLSLPPGAPCPKEIGTYQNVVKSALATGNVEQKDYDQIQHELSRAAAACSSGKGGEAHAIVATSKERHGYRA